MDTQCPGHVGVIGSEVNDHAARTIIATGMSPMNRTDILKSEAEELGQEKERACVDIQYTSTENEGLMWEEGGKEEPGGWMVEFEVARTKS